MQDIQRKNKEMSLQAQSINLVSNLNEQVTYLSNLTNFKEQNLSHTWMMVMMRHELKAFWFLNKNLNVLVIQASR